MPKLPGPDEVAVSAPDFTQGRIPQLNLTSAGAGEQAFGRDVQQSGLNLFGVAMERTREQRLKDEEATKQKEAYDTAAAWQDFESKQRLASKDLALNMKPGGDGLVQDTTNTFWDSAKPFWESVPDRLKPEYKERIHALGGTLTNTNALIAQDEQGKYTTYQDDKGIDQSILAAGKDQGVLNQSRKDALARNQTMPYMDPEAKRQRDDKINFRYQKAFAETSNKDPSTNRQIFSGSSGDVIDQAMALTQSKEGAHGSTTIKNPNSSATGLYQIESGTWASIRHDHPELSLPDSVASASAEQQTSAARALTQDNSKALQRGGIENPSPGDLYMAHFLGAGGAISFLNAVKVDPNMPATNVVGPKQVGANRAVFFDGERPRTVGEVYAKMTNGIPSGQAPGVAMPSDDYNKAYDWFKQQPIMEGASPEMIHDAANMAVTEHRSLMAELKATLENAQQDVPAAIRTTGTYSGAPMPTQQDFVDAYGPEGLRQHQAFQANVEAAKVRYGAKAQTNEEIAKTIQQYKPGNSGPGAAISEARSNAITTDLTRELEDRKKGPDYVIASDEKGASLWDAVAKAAPEDRSQALRDAIGYTIAKQQFWGNPATSIKPLPTAMAAQIADEVKKDTANPDRQLSTVAGTLNAAGQYAPDVFQQLVEGGLPPATAGAIEALQGGNEPGAKNLWKAMTLPKEVVWPKMTEDQIGAKSKDLSTALAGKLDAYREAIYGVPPVGKPGAQASIPEASLTRMARDEELLVKDTQMHMTNGSDQKTAIDQALQDRYGHLDVVTDKQGKFGVNVAAPKGTDPQILAHGLAAIEGPWMDQRVAQAKATRFGARSVQFYVGDQGGNLEWRSVGKDGVGLYNKASGLILPDSVTSYQAVLSGGRVRSRALANPASPAGAGLQIPPPSVTPGVGITNQPSPRTNPKPIPGLSPPLDPGFRLPSNVAPLDVVPAEETTQ